MRIRRGLHNYLVYQTEIDKDIPNFIQDISDFGTYENGLFSKINYIIFYNNATRITN